MLVLCLRNIAVTVPMNNFFLMSWIKIRKTIDTICVDNLQTTCPGHWTHLPFSSSDNIKERFLFFSLGGLAVITFFNTWTVSTLMSIFWAAKVSIINFSSLHSCSNFFLGGGLSITPISRRVSPHSSKLGTFHLGCFHPVMNIWTLHCPHRDINILSHLHLRSPQPNSVWTF